LVLVEDVYEQRRTHDKLDLPFVHTGAQLVHHFLVDDIPLLNFRCMHDRELVPKRGIFAAPVFRGRAARGQQGCYGYTIDERLSHLV
jgi:hypothetical protein